jgi:lysophospholipase L1-like esterase
MRLFPIKPALTILTLAGLLAFSGHLKGLREPDAQTLLSVVDFPAPHISETVSNPTFKLPAVSDRTPAVAGSFLNDDAGAMDRFYEALWRTERKEAGAITRIVHYGDSPTTADLITGDARAFLQQKFGDAGHGFTLMAKPWAWYEHRGVTLSQAGWKSNPSSQSKIRDGLFGLGGVMFINSGEAHSRFVLASRTHTKAEVCFLRMPGGGAFTVWAEGNQLGEVQTDSPEKLSGFSDFDLPPDTGVVEVRTQGKPVRLFGVIFEKPGPGITYDSLGMNGAYTAILAHKFEEMHWAEQLKHRNPDLVVVNYGSNESGFAFYTDRYYEKELREVVRRIRSALPQASILLMSPMDRGERRSGGEIATLVTIPKLVRIQQSVAKETDCAFFDTFHAMGGEGTMALWYASQPRLVSADFLHPTPAGAKLVGDLLCRAVCEGFNRYKLRRMRENLRMANAN